jgi:hypothetical protein
LIPFTTGFVLGVFLPIRRPAKNEPAAPVPDDLDVPSVVIWRRTELVKLGLRLDEAKVLGWESDVVTRAKALRRKGATAIQTFRLLKP